MAYENQSVRQDQIDMFTLALNITIPSVNCEEFEAELAAVRDPFRAQVYLRPFILCLYSTIIGLGAFGNLLVVAAVIHNPQMRTPRNYFIINLAVSDLILCTVTVPFTMHLVLDHFWPFGVVMCKFVASLQGVNIFVSTLCITAISLDRYLVILIPTDLAMQNVALIVSFFLVWGISILLALPQGFFTTTITPLSEFPTALLCGRAGLEMCKEAQDLSKIRRTYAICCFVLQYCLPLVTLTIVYHKLMAQLRTRMSFRKRAIVRHDIRQEEDARQQRAHLLIVLIVTIFAVVWLPINLYNTIVNFVPQIDSAEGFVFCHMIGMISGCANPILYGVLNYNFNREFKELLRWNRIKAAVKRRCPNCFPDRSKVVTRVSQRLPNPTLVPTGVTPLPSTYNGTCVSHHPMISYLEDKLSPDSTLMTALDSSERQTLVSCARHQQSPQTLKRKARVQLSL